MEDEEEDTGSTSVAPPLALLTFDPCGSSILRYVGLSVIATVISIIKKIILKQTRQKTNKLKITSVFIGQYYFQHTQI